MARALSNPVYLTSPEKGVDGRTTLAGARAPLITDGRIGDFWFDTTPNEQRLYGPKNAAGWPDLGLVKGNRGWTPVFASLGRKTQGLAPAWTMWAAPGFGATGRYVEMEVWAVPQAPHPAFQALDAAAPNRLLRMSGTPTGQISSGALVAPYAELLFLSGIVAPEGTAPEDEGRTVLTLMNERLKAMNATMADVAELRVYRVAAERFMVVPNASNREQVADALRERLEGYDAVLDDASLRTSLVAVQGPRAAELLQPVGPPRHPGHIERPALAVRAVATACAVHQAQLGAEPVASRRQRDRHGEVAGTGVQVGGELLAHPTYPATSRRQRDQR